jgi:outer membrane protein OmpA-like peptidoglycan-associated protein
MIQKYIAFIGMTFISMNISFSQVEDEACLPPAKKILKLIETAKTAPDAATAVTSFNEAIKANPDNALVYFEYAMYAYQNGVKYYDTYKTALGDKSFQKAEDMFIEALNHCKDYHADCSYLLGVINYSQTDMTEATKWFKIFKNYSNNDKSKYPSDYAKKLEDVNAMLLDLEAEADLNSKKVPFDPKKVPNVSSANPEYFPMISPDNELMFFTRKVDAGGMGEIVRDKIEEQFSYSLRPNISTPFDTGKKFNKPFNDGTFQSYGAATMSVDNKEMIICACKNEMQASGQNYLNCDLYRTEFERSGAGGNDFTWTPLENMGTGINTKNGWEGQPTLSADGNTMYYTCMRPNTRDNDIYVVERDKNGKWGASRPFDEINTDGKDKSPFLHQDSETLYFVSTCSDTRKGAGGLDIFYVRRENGIWSKPKNIGIPINTPEDELGIFVSTNGELAYYSSRVGGDWNIYAFELYEEARPSAVTIMKGELKGEDGEPIKGASIEVAYAGSNEKSTIKVNGNDGKYAVVVKNPTKQDVMVTVKKEGYAFDSKLITKEEFVAQASVAPKDVLMASNTKPVNSTTKPVNSTSKPPIVTNKTETPTNKKPVVTTTESVKVKEATASNTPVSMPKNDLVVKKLKVGVAYTLNDILFETNSSVLSDRSKFILKEFSSFLLENPTSKILIQGHTDDQGVDAENLKLSENRANAVKNYLVSLNIKADRLTSKGYGSSIPKVDNTTPENRAKNRRTDFVIEKL